MNHQEKILQTLDHNLTRPTRLILYGRAALALGFVNAPTSFHATMDVDAILPEVAMSMLDADEQFWTAIEETNEQLAASGLYITHLFTDSQVALSPDWLDHLESIELAGSPISPRSPRPSIQMPGGFARNYRMFEAPKPWPYLKVGTHVELSSPPPWSSLPAFV